MRLILALLILSTAPLFAEKKPVVHTVLLVAPDCPDCDVLLNDILPDLNREFGDQLQFEMIDVSTARGETIYREAVEYVPIPSEKMYLPAVIVDRQVYVGSNEINKELRPVVKHLLPTGGADLPALPSLESEKKQTVKTTRAKIGFGFR